MTTTVKRGTIKQDPDTGKTAVRTGRDPDAPNAWFVADLDNGGYWASAEEVDRLELLEVADSPVVAKS